MITLDFPTKTNGEPILSKDMIEILAEQVISSYKPVLISNPGALDVELFIENYAGLEMDYQDLTHNGSILGMTVFNDCNVPVYDADHNKAKYISVNEGTVLIDNSLLEERQLRRGRFTLAHEAAHWLLHRQMYIQNKDQVSLFDTLDIEEKRLPIIKCRTSDIEGGRRQLITNEDWMEWHADYMASALLMPKNAFVKATRDKLKTAYPPEAPYLMGTDLFLDLEIEELTSELADIFEVSITAANIRLKNLGFISVYEDHSLDLF